VAHESHTTSLRSAAEEGNLDLTGTEILSIVVHGIPCWLLASAAEVVQLQKLSLESTISLDNAAVTDVQQRN
jgi:hypothetical protein